MKRSAGLLPFQQASVLSVLIAHPGGPFFAGQDAGAWSIVKGEIEAGEDALAAARREFTEETGWSVPDGTFFPLGEITQRSGKRVTAYALDAHFDIATFEPGMFDLFWRGRRRTFPEVDEVRWTNVDEARRLLNPAQRPLIDRLVELSISSG